jgi:transcriptional regulator of arginine metabolism
MTTTRVPGTKTARQQLIVDLVSTHPVRSQSELAELLGESGVTVNQATLSRDLVELDAVKVRSAAGLVYAVPGEGGDRSPVVADTVASHGSPRAAVRGAAGERQGVREPGRAAHAPGAAQFFASAIDHAAPPGVLGSIAATTPCW